MPKLLVFGGLGFIGANFVQWALRNLPGLSLKIADAYTYAADLGRLPEGYQGEIRHCRLQDPGDYSDLMAWADIVINFAAETHNDRSLENPALFFDSNVNGTLQLLQSCIENNTALIQVSTDEVFGDFPLHSVDSATEDYPYRPSSPYSASKAASDLMVLAWMRSFGLKAILTNCTNNYGPNQHPEKLIPNVVSKVKLNRPIQLYGNGQNVRDWLHVDDHSAALGLLLQGQYWGDRFNISANNHLSNIDLVNVILGEMGVKNHPIEYVDDRPGHDIKYSLNSTKLRSLGWAPQKHLKAEYSHQK